MNKELRKILDKHVYVGHGGVIPKAWFDELEKDLEALIQEDKWISVSKENRILINWLRNLTRKIMRYDEFKGLRGYPITYFIEKYYNQFKKRGGCNQLGG